MMIPDRTKDNRRFRISRITAIKAANSITDELLPKKLLGCALDDTRNMKGIFVFLGGDPRRTVIRWPHRFVLLGALLLVCVYAYYHLVAYRDYLLRGDEPAYVSANLGSWVEWFTRGYRDYFAVYPEWPSAVATDLLKPVTNGVGHVNLALFGSVYALHFATYFSIQLVGLVVFVRLLKELAVPTAPAAFMALLFLFNPAFMNAGLLCLSCHFDVLAGVLVLAAFVAVWRARYGAALALLTLALFTKEISVFAPAAAAVSLLLWRRPVPVAALMLAPLAVWIAARLLVYGDVTSGRLASVSSGIARGLSVWPTGLGSDGFTFPLASPAPVTRGDFVAAVFLVANVGLWGFMAYAAWVTGKRPTGSQARALLSGLFVWMLGALAFGVLVGHHARYGGSYYPFLYLFLAGFFFSRDVRVPRWVAACVLLTFLATTVAQGVRHVRLASVWQTFIAPERALHDALRALPQDGRTVYVVNAPPSFASAPHHLNRAWRLDLDVVIVNQFEGCTAASDPGTPRAIEGTADMNVRLPDCAAFKFGAVPAEFLARGLETELRREGVGTYRFADKEEQRAEGLGHTLLLSIEGGKESTVIAYDWTRGAYAVIERH